jgi:8-oxo-dGTP diphosphatase
MAYTPILATLGYVVLEDRVLLIKKSIAGVIPEVYNGLGGKLEPNEDALAGFKRELLEESGITALECSLRGTVSWPGFGKNGEDWFGIIFLVTHWSGQVTSGNEGQLGWFPLTQLLNLELPLWPGDKYFLPLVFDTNPRPFFGVMPYANGKPLSWNFSR